MATLYRVSWRSFLALAVLFVLSAGNLLAQWTEMPYLPNPRSQHAVAFVDGKIYLAGGVVAKQTQATDTRMLDIAGGASDWSNLAALDGPRWGSYGAAIGGKFYIANGIFQTQQGYSFVVRVAEFDPAKNSYTLRAAQPVPTVNAAGAVVGGKLILTGGMSVSGNNFALTRATQMYDPATDTWKQLSDGPAGAVGSTMVAIDNTLYLIGGSVNTTDYANAYKGTFNGTDITWQPIADYPMPITGAASGVLNGKIVVTGGTSGGTATTKTYVYDPATRKWTASFGLPMASSGVHNLVGNGTDALYMVSGEDNPNVYKFTEGESKAVAKLGSTELILTVVKGQQKSESISVENKGTLALTVTPQIPGTATWLTSAAVTVTPGAQSDLNLTVNTSSLELGYHTATVNLATNDPDQATIPVTVRLFVVNEVTTSPTRVVIEEGTGEWCQYCPWGHEVLADIKDIHGDDVIMLAYHGGSTTEPMRTTAGQKLLDMMGIGGYPNASIQRWMFPGEVNQMLDINGAETQFMGHVDEVLEQTPASPITITVSNQKYDATAKKVTATVKVKVGMAYPMNDAMKLSMTALVVQDSINYAQTMAQRDGSPTVRLPSYIHRDVVRAVYPNENGMELEVPAASMQDGLIVPGSEITQEISIPANFGTTIPFDVNKASIVILVHQSGGSKLGPIVQGFETRILSGAAPVIAIAPGETSKTVNSGQMANFSAQVSNLTAENMSVTVERVSNQLPTGWTSEVGVNDTWNAPENNGPFTMTIGGSGTGVAQLRINPSSVGTGRVTLRFTSGATTFDREYTVVAGTASVGGNAAERNVMALTHYPNPTNGLTNILFELSKGGNTVLEVYTVTGDKLATLSSGYLDAGTHNVAFDASTLSNGVYMVSLTNNGVKVNRFVTVVR